MELCKSFSVVFATAIFILCRHESLESGGQQDKLPFPVIFVILSQPHHYHRQLADEAKEFIISQAENLGWEIPVIYLSHEEWPDVIGAWTIFPLLDRLIEKLQDHHSWLCICEDVTRVDIKNLVTILERFNKSEDHFLGHALRDREATIIHHFAFSDNPSSFAYPDFAAACFFSVSLLIKTSERWKRAKHHDFSIDAKHELAKFIWNEGKGIALLYVKELCLSRRTQHCSTWLTNSFPPCKFPVKKENVCFAVKTCEKFHLDRVPVVKSTWGKEANCITYYSDKEDSVIPTVNLGIPNVPHGHAAKTIGIIQHFIQSKAYENKDWLVIVDDDTLLSVSRLLGLLKCYNPKESIALGERYGYDVTNSYGYNYITGGGGMVFSKSLATQLQFCHYRTEDSPDDMILGMCLKNLGIPIIHSKMFHQARSVDYAPEYLSYQQPISFHKHWMIDPRQMYYEWLVDESETTDKKKHAEL